MAVIFNSNQFKVKDENGRAINISVLEDHTIQQTKQDVIEAINDQNRQFVDIDDIKNSFAQLFDRTKQYKVGQYVLYKENGADSPTILYRYTSNHTQNTEWNIREVERVRMGTELTDLVKISSNEPDNDNTKIWVSPDAEDEYEIPTWKEIKMIGENKRIRENLRDLFLQEIQPHIIYNVNDIEYTEGITFINASGNTQQQQFQKITTNFINVDSNQTYYFYYISPNNYNILYSKHLINRVIQYDNNNVIKTTNDVLGETIYTYSYRPSNNSTKIKFCYEALAHENVIITDIDLDTIEFNYNDYFNSCINEQGLINIVQAGADNTGTYDCQPLIQKIVNQIINENSNLKSQGIYFPKGIYSIENTITFNNSNTQDFPAYVPSIILKGETIIPEKYDGLNQDTATKVYKYHGSILQFNLPSYYFNPNVLQASNIKEQAMINIWSQVHYTIQNLTFYGDHKNHHVAQLAANVNRSRSDSAYPVKTMRLGFPLPNNNKFTAALPTQIQKIGINNDNVSGYKITTARALIKNCIFHGFGTVGVRIRNALSQVNTCIFQKCKVGIEYQCVDSLIVNPYMQWCTRGITMTGANARIMYPRIEEIQQYGILMQSSANVIVGGWIDKTDWASICIVNSGEGGIGNVTIDGTLVTRGGCYYGGLDEIEIMKTIPSTYIENSKYIQQEFRKACNIYIGYGSNININGICKTARIHDKDAASGKLAVQIVPGYGYILDHCKNVNIITNGDANNCKISKDSQNIKILNEYGLMNYYTNGITYNNLSSNIALYTILNKALENNIDLLPYLNDFNYNLGLSSQSEQAIKHFYLYPKTNIKYNSGVLTREDASTDKYQASQFIDIQNHHAVKLKINDFYPVYCNIRCYDQNYNFLGTATVANKSSMTKYFLKDTRYIRILFMNLDNNKLKTQQDGTKIYDSDNNLLPVHNRYYNHMITFQFTDITNLDNFDQNIISRSTIWMEKVITISTSMEQYIVLYSNEWLD